MGLKIDRRVQKATKILGITLLIFLAFFLLKIFIWEQWYYRTKTGETRKEEQIVITELADAVNPSEVAPSAEDYAKYQVAASYPRYLEIPRLEVKARIKDSNVNEHVMPVPDNIYDVSWYSGSGRPNDGRNILISGISESQSVKGAFANLDSLENGNEIIIECGNGERYTYEIQGILIIDRDDAEKQLSTAQKRIDDKETLSLITARKEGDKNAFNSIVIVRATKK